MAKFLKSFFHTSDGKKRNSLRDGEDDRDFNPPLDSRRKLSISRSGRMKQANKKRHSLSLEVYGENFTAHEKPTSKEYHVKKPTQIVPKVSTNEPSSTKDAVEVRAEKRPSAHSTTPEEEIEIAFKIIDNTT